jgi:hypothetical protein
MMIMTEGSSIAVKVGQVSAFYGKPAHAMADTGQVCLGGILQEPALGSLYTE